MKNAYSEAWTNRKMKILRKVEGEGRKTVWSLYLKPESVVRLGKEDKGKQKAG
jgi:hypothetical protein